MSPRAACRLAALGFTEVYDYVNGKSEWLGYGLATGGADTRRATAGSAAREDAVGCRIDERVGPVRQRVERSPYGFALVMSGSGVLLGRLRKTVLDADPDARADAVMEAGPSTVRPDTPGEELAARLRERRLTTAIVTNPDGRLVGVVRSRDLR